MGCVIAGSMDTAIEYMLTFRQRTWAKGEIAILLRLSTHILLALRDIQVEHNQDAANEIIRQYVDALMEFHVVQPAQEIQLMCRTITSRSTLIISPDTSASNPTQPS